MRVQVLFGTVGQRGRRLPNPAGGSARRIPPAANVSNPAMQPVAISQTLFLSGHFPQDGRIPVYDVAQNSAPSRPTVLRRFPEAVFGSGDHCHGAPAAGDGDSLAKLFDLVEAGEAFHLELGRTPYPVLHASQDNRPYVHLGFI
jgi:hypothetical protein